MEQAEVIEKFIPLILKKVAMQADTDELMHLGTINGPTLLGPFSLAISNDWSKFIVLGPPEPAISPVLGLETSSGESPESLIACSIESTE